MPPGVGQRRHRHQPADAGRRGRSPHAAAGRGRTAHALAGARTGCCRDAATRLPPGAEPRRGRSAGCLPGPPAPARTRQQPAGAGALGLRLGRRSLRGPDAGRSRAGGAQRGQRARQGRPERPGQEPAAAAAGAAAAGAGAAAAGAGAAFFAGAGFGPGVPAWGPGVAARRFSWRARRRQRPRSQASCDATGGSMRRGRSLDELADLLQLLQRDLAVDAVLLRESRDTRVLATVAPSGPTRSAREVRPLVGGGTNWLIARYSSSAHELMLQFLSVDRCRVCIEPGAFHRLGQPSPRPGDRRARGRRLAAAPRGHSTRPWGAGAPHVPAAVPRRIGHDGRAAVCGPEPAVTRSNSRLAARSRHPMHVRTGPRGEIVSVRAGEFSSASHQAINSTGSRGVGITNRRTPRRARSAQVAGASSEWMSIRQPVRRAARRAFWPSLPIASDSWKSGTTTRGRHGRPASTTVDGAAPGRATARGRPARPGRRTSRRCRSSRRAARPSRCAPGWPIGPMQAPLALTPGTVELDRDLGAVAGLARDRGDLDGAVGDLRDLEREELLHQVRVRARERDLRAAHALADRRRPAHLIRVPWL